MQHFVFFPFICIRDCSEKYGFTKNKVLEWNSRSSDQNLVKHSMWGYLKHKMLVSQDLLLNFRV